MRAAEGLPFSSTPTVTRCEMGLPVERLGDPILVCFGVDVRGGGNRGVLRKCIVLSRSGPEPGDGSVSNVDAAVRRHVRQCISRK